MKKQKKLMSLIISAAVLFSAAGTSQALSLDNSTLTDIDSHWSEDDITLLYRAGILKGADNLANPDKNITRGEFTALITRALSLEGKGNALFSDVPAGHVFFDDISAAASAGVITGTGDGNFCPSNLITREEIMLIVSRCLPANRSKNVSFTDISSDYIYLDNLKTAVFYGIISGYSDGKFKPESNATRAESASVIVRLMKASDGASESSIRSFSRKYAANDFENTGLNSPLATGKALEELYHRIGSAEQIAQNGAAVRKTLSGLTLTSMNVSGLLSSVRYEGDAKYSLTYSDGTSKTNMYRCEISMEIIDKGGVLYVYSYNMNLKKPEKINLTWEVYSQAPDYAPSGVNVVSPSSFQISAENLNVEATKLRDGINFFNSMTYAYMSYAETNGYDVWPMYKTDFSLSTSNKFLNDASSRQKALGLLIKYACKYKIDGINFDFENVYVSDRDILTKHMREVTLALHEMGLTVSADVTRKEITSGVWSMCYDRDAIAETVDYVMLMAYDEHYAGSPVAGSVAGLDWTEDTIKLTLGEVDAEKLILGMPLYMRCWEITNGKVTSSRAISMQTAYNLINENTVSYEWIESDGQYKISWQSGGKTYAFWLENTETIKARTALARKYSLAGVATWRRGLEIMKVWDVIRNALG